ILLMTATGHAVIGTVIAAKIGNPALAIPLALASHVAADFFPHWDTGFERYKKSENIFIRNSVVDVIMSFTLFSRKPATHMHLLWSLRHNFLTGPPPHIFF